MCIFINSGCIELNSFIKLSFLFFLCTCGAVYSEDVREIAIEKIYVENAENVEAFLKKNSSQSNLMIFTHVPRGLVVSIDEKLFFNEGSAKIKTSAIPILEDIISVLVKVDNNCVIEGHTEKNNFDNKPYDYNWELSLQRAGNIVAYLIKYGKISPDRLFSLGYGEYMPANDNVSETMNLNKRIDFVFIDYRSKY